MDQKLSKSEEEEQELTSGYWKDRLVTIVEQGDEESLERWRNDLRNRILEIKKQICNKVYEAYRRTQNARRHAANILSETKYRTLMRNVERMLIERDLDQMERLKVISNQHKRKADESVEDKDDENINARLIRLSETKTRYIQLEKVDLEKQ